MIKLAQYTDLKAAAIPFTLHEQTKTSMKLTSLKLRLQAVRTTNSRHTEKVEESA